MSDPVVEPVSEASRVETIMAEAERLKAAGETAPRLARDPVNLPQIHTWLEAIGDPNPVYRDTPEAAELYGGPVAPPAMAQVWTMYGLGLPGTDPLAGRAGDPLHQMMQVLDRAGLTSVLGTNCDQTYDRYLRPGERVSVTTRLESVVGPKRTAVGEGYFVTTCSTWRVGEEQVATMLFRVLKYRPAKAAPVVEPARSASPVVEPARSAESKPLRPVVNRDTQFFWDGTLQGELRIQRCEDCGVLRHPPGPMCPHCRSTKRGWMTASGRGAVYSYVVHRAPPVPGKTLPLLIAVVELEDGVRMVGELRGVDTAAVEIGMPVEVAFERVDDGLAIAYWQPPATPQSADSSRHVDASQGARPLSSVHNPALQRLDGWEVPITTRFVVSTALATRDFQDVHHDRDLAIERGSKDIFLNILTTTGLVQRYVGAWAGPAAVIKACELRLGAPAHPGDTLAFTGEVSEVVGVDGERRHVVDVVGTVPAGAHVTARVTVALPPTAVEPVESPSRGQQ